MKKFKILLSPIVFLLAIGFAFGQTAPDKTIEGKVENAPLPIDPNVKIGKLKNGLTYYIRNNGKPEDKVELRLVVNAGSILEDDDQKGLAHFLEHMNFNGTTNFKKNELVDYLQSIGVEFGADLNAYTGFDETVYILPIPSDDPEKLEKGFQILEDWAHNALLTEKDIDEERGVVLEEYRLGLSAERRMLQKYLPKIMNNSKYAERLPIGTKETIEKFDYETLRRFYKDWYRPDLMAVIAVGDLDVAQLEAKIIAHFDKIEPVKNPRPRTIAEVPNHKETYVAIESDKEAAFSEVELVYKEPGNRKIIETVADFRQNMVEGLFTTMINNRLNELANKPNPPFVYGYTYHGGTWAREKEAYQSFAMTSETGQLTALKTLLEENERVKRFGFQQGEFERAKKDYMANLEKSYKDRDKQESGNIVWQYVSHFLESQPIPGVEWEYGFAQKELEGIKLEEVNSLINTFLRDDNRVVILTGPEKDGLEKVSEEQVRNLLEEVEKADIVAYNDGNTRTELMTFTPKKGSIVKMENNEKIGTTTLTLSNGAKVVFKKTDFKNDEVLFEAFSFGGTSLYDTETLLKIGQANGGLNEAGVDGLSLNDLNKVMSGKIANANPFIGSISEGFNGNATPKDLEALFQLVHLYFTKLNKDDEAFASFINKQKAFITNLSSNPQFYFSIEQGKFLNEGNPRYIGFPTPETLDNSDYSLAYQKYQERFANAGDFIFYFVGNIDETQLAGLAETYLASLPGTTEKETFVVDGFRPKTGSHELIVKKGKDPKSRVSLQYRGETGYSADESRAMMFLGEILTIKLIESLREKESGVYGAGANGSLSKLPYATYNFNISFPCGPENVDKLIAASLAEVQKIIDNGPEDKDLAKVKESLLLKHKEELKQNRYWLTYLKNSDYLGTNVEEVLNYEAKVNAMTKEQVQEVAKKYLTKGYIKAILMPEE